MDSRRSGTRNLRQDGDGVPGSVRDCRHAGLGHRQQRFGQRAVAGLMGSGASWQVGAPLPRRSERRSELSLTMQRSPAAIRPVL